MADVDQELVLAECRKHKLVVALIRRAGEPMPSPETVIQALRDARFAFEGGYWRCSSCASAYRDGAARRRIVKGEAPRG